MTQHDQALYPPIEPTKAGLAGTCPRCGQGQLFAGMLKFRPACSNCGLDYSALDVGDGAVVFVIMIANVVVLGGALAFENAAQPPIWLHVLIWPPVALGLCIWLTRLIKGVLLAHQFERKASPGRIET
ncbi:MAG: DUF983 domain-containing protein [Phyllobacteriaceae bacterium]|nr:DUF983 domain-containing protein [Phyllobacteriaceae bacterium]